MVGQSFYKIIGTTGNDYAEQVINDRDSGYVVVGGTEGLGQGEMDGYMIKLDTAGNIQWTRTFGNENVDWLTGVVLLDDGMLACGYSNVQGDYQMYVVRTNEIGQVVWEKWIGNENWEFPQELTMINDTTAMIVGEVYLDGQTTKDGLVAAITISGDSLYYHTYGNAYDDVLERVILSDSNQIYVCGSYEVEEEDSDYWVGRLDHDGNFLWELFLGDTLNDYGHGITELITGEFIVTGGDLDTTTTNIDNVFYKIDSTGTVIFQNILNNPADDIGMDVLSYPDTNKFILITETSSLGLGGFNSWVFDCNYYTFGVEDFSYNFGTTLDEYTKDADTTFDKGVIIVGNMYDPVMGNTIFVHKTNTEANALSTYLTEQDLNVEDINEVLGGVFPNPVRDEINFSNAQELMGSNFEIVDLSGQIVVTGVVRNDRLSVSLANGYYLLKVDNFVWRFVVSNP
jgi:hypothetical protein